MILREYTIISSVGLYSYLQNYLSLFGRVGGNCQMKKLKKGEREKIEKKLPNEKNCLVLLLLLLSVGVV